MSEESSWRDNGYKKRKNIEIRPVMAPKHPTENMGDVFVDKNKNAFSYNDNVLSFGKMTEKNVMVYDYSYVSGDFQNDFYNMVKFFKSGNNIEKTISNFLRNSE